MANLTAIETGENLLGHLGYKIISHTSIRTGITRSYYAAREEYLQDFRKQLVEQVVDLTFERRVFLSSHDRDEKVTNFHGVIKEITPHGIKLLHMDHMKGRVHFMPWYSQRVRDHQVMMKRHLTRLALVAS